MADDASPDADGTLRWEAEVAATHSEWRAMLGPALQPYTWGFTGPDACEIALSRGVVRLSWTVLPERAIALLRLPRLRVWLRATREVSPEDWMALRRRLDLYTQRGGG